MAVKLSNPVPAGSQSVSIVGKMMYFYARKPPTLKSSCRLIFLLRPSLLGAGLNNYEK
jgi:hypothetical protein